MNKYLIFLNQPHFCTGPFLNGVSTRSKVLDFSRKRIVTRSERFVDFFLRLDFRLQLTHPLPPAFAPP